MRPVVFLMCFMGCAGVLLFEGGFRFNATASMPRGFYQLVPGKAAVTEHGDLVSFCLEDASFTPLALVYLLIQYHLAAENRRFLWLLAADLPVLLAGLILFHADLPQVLWVVGLNHLLLFLAGYAFTPRRDAVAELPLAVPGA